MVTVESFGYGVELTPEHLTVRLTESTIQALKNLVSQQPILKEALDSLLRWADFPMVWVKDILSVSLEAIPSTPEGEHLFKLMIFARFRGGQRTYEVPMKPEDAKTVASEIEKLIKKRF